MRKILALGAAALLFAAAPAFASVSFSGSIKYEVTSQTSEYDFDSAERSLAPDFSDGYKLTVNFAGGEEGLWSLSGTIDPKDLALSSVKLVLTPPEFTLTAAVKTDIGTLADPFSFVSLDSLAENEGVRLETSAFGPKLVAQLDENNKSSLGLKGDLSLDPVSIGAIARLPIPDNKGVDVVGYASVKPVPILTLTGAFGRDKNEKNAYAAKAVVTPITGLKVDGSYKVDFGAARTISSSGTYEIDLLQPGASFSVTTDKDGKLTDRTLKGTVKFRGSADNPAFADLFNDDVTPWYNYKALAAAVSVTQNVKTETDKPKLTLDAKVATPVLPGVAVARAYLTYESDQDGAFDAFKETGYDAATATNAEYGFVSAKSHLLIDTALRYNLTDKISVTPSLKVHSWGDATLVESTDPKADPAQKWSASVSGLDLGVSVAYKLSASASVSLGVTRESRSFNVEGAKPAGVPDSVSQLKLSLAASASF